MPDAQEESAQLSAQEDQPAESPAAAAASPEKPPRDATPPSVHTFPRRRRLGRPPKNRPPDWDSPRPGDEERGGSEQGTPFRRKRGRPPGFRGRARGQSYAPSKVRIDKEGTMADVVDDEIVLPDDPEGEEKVDKNGNLLGGREYRVRTFTIMNRGKKLFMLSTEPARCCGFRDSYLFFTKHMSLHKVIVEEDEKRDLIDRDVIPHSYKGRAIGVVTARSVFREFGARIVVGGKKVIDDYWGQAARDRGDVEGEIADPNDRLPPDGQPYNRNQYVAWHGASAVYHTNLPAIPITNGKPLPPKRRVQITSANWQFEHARAARFVEVCFEDLRLTNAAISTRRS
jgi:chromatin structure-remodeling complex protein RSC7